MGIFQVVETVDDSLNKERLSQIIHNSRPSIALKIIKAIGQLKDQKGIGSIAWGFVVDVQ